MQSSSQFTSQAFGIGAYLDNGDLEDKIEEEIFVSQPIHTQTQQKDQTVRKQEFSHPSQLQFCLPTPGIFQNQRPPPLKIVNSATLSGKNNKSKAKGKRPFSASASKFQQTRTAKSALSWKQPPFNKSKQVKTNNKSVSKNQTQLSDWNSGTQTTKLFDDIKGNTLQRQMILQKKKQAQFQKSKSNTQFGGLRVTRDDTFSHTLVQFQGKNQERKLQIFHDGKILSDQSGNKKTAQAMAIERKQILKEREKKQRELKQKQALLFKQKSELLGKSRSNVMKSERKNISISKPTLADDKVEIRRNQEILQMDDGKLEQLRAGIDLNLQKRDQMILDLRSQFEKLLENRKQMNTEFCKKIQTLEDEKSKMKSIMLSKLAGNIDNKKPSNNNVPTRDPGFGKNKRKKESPPRNQKVTSSTSTPQKKKLVSTIQKNPDHMLSEAMIKHQIERQVQLDYEKNVTQKILLSMRENPNSQLYLMQKEVDALTQKLAPVMERVQTTVTNMNELNYVRQKSNSIGMVSRMAGKFMAINSDKIVDMMLDELLEETVFQLEKIESELKESMEDEESKKAAEQLLGLLGQFNYTADKVQQKLYCGKLTNELKQRKKMNQKQKKIQIEGIQLTEQSQPTYKHPFNIESSGQYPRKLKTIEKKVRFGELNDEIYDDDDDQEEEEEKGFQNIKFRNKEQISYEGQVLLKQNGIKISKLAQEHFKSIQSGMLKYSEYVVRSNGSDNEQVWKLYDHICDDLFTSLFSQTVKIAQSDIEGALEGMIADEILGSKK